ncbi:hypothetical protein TthAA22_25150 (plasmid) [Thermus thermophilus]|nr:hypothetical protein TthAA22_25150 [Thermus thermophilus]
MRESVYVALGIAPDGERRVLGFWLLPSESALGWEGSWGALAAGPTAGIALHHRRAARAS